MKNFAITGAAGYVAPRHLKAIKDTGNKLIAACDPHDSVGILDSYFPEASFFTEIERFDRHLVKMRHFKKEDKIDYLSICSPNYLHDAHIRLALRLDADAICEKPLVLKPSNVDALVELEKESGRKVYNVLQLRVHPAIIDLKKQIDEKKKDHKYNITLSYITSRGPWYQYSWKGNHEKSGGIATNIGIHFFDMLIWIFGKVQRTDLFLNEFNKMSGFIELENANVRWFLSIDRDDLPQSAIDKGHSTFRSITYDDKEIEFTGGFTDLHTLVYQDILEGKGYGLMSALPSIELVYGIRNTELRSINDSAHPFLIK
jgi:UDP-N-acetyl-2-amino-2-deoxyglucuronate dehydrogenase